MHLENTIRAKKLNKKINNKIGIDESQESCFSKVGMFWQTQINLIKEFHLIKCAVAKCDVRVRIRFG